MTKSSQLFPLLLCLLLPACASAPKHQLAPDTANAAKRHSAFEITYSMGGHAEHRLSGFSTPAAPQMAAYLERSVIEERSIQAETYDQYFTKIVNFASQPQRLPSQNSECRSPFSIVAKIDGKTYGYKGCRNQSDDKSFSKLLRQGEFLLYSKK